MHSTCAIWGTKAEELLTSGDYRRIASSRACGAYRVTGSAERMVAAASVTEKRAITQWLLRQRSFGVSEPTIDTRSFDVARQLAPLTFTEKVDAAVIHLGRSISRMDDVLEIVSFGDLSDQVAELIARTDCVDLKDLRALLHTVEKMGLIETRDNVVTVDGGRRVSAEHHSLSSGGWQRFENLSTKVPSSHQAFVAMWFNPTMQDAFKDGIAPAISDAGYSPLRIDNKEHINKVDDEIIAEIRRSRFVVCDFTCEPQKPRGGVYFEAGFAMGLNIPVIWTCKDTSIADLHFDTRQYNHIVWKDAADLRKQLFARIGAVLGDGPLKGVT